MTYAVRSIREAWTLGTVDWTGWASWPAPLSSVWPSR